MIQSTGNIKLKTLSAEDFFLHIFFVLAIALLAASAPVN